jgi:hypothetical protein
VAVGYPGRGGGGMTTEIESQLRKRGWKLIAESVGGRWRSVTQVEEVAV